jgi:hypothetical protein
LPRRNRVLLVEEGAVGLGRTAAAARPPDLSRKAISARSAGRGREAHILRLDKILLGDEAAPFEESLYFWSSRRTLSDLAVGRILQPVVAGVEGGEEFHLRDLGDRAKIKDALLPRLVGPQLVGPVRLPRKVKATRPRPG